MKKKMSIVLATVLMLSNSLVAYAGEGDAFCVGCSMAPVGDDAAVDSRNEATLACNEFCRNDGADMSPILKTTPTADHLESYLDSSVVYLAGHGNMVKVTWPYADGSKTVSLTTYSSDTGDYYSILNESFQNIDVAIIAACSAGIQGGVADAIQQRGATTTFGWRVDAENTPMRDYGLLMAKHLSNGKTVTNAVVSSTADMIAGETHSGFAWDTVDYNGNLYPDPDAPYFQTAIYGDANNTITDGTNERSATTGTITTPSSDITIYSDIVGLEYETYSYEIEDIVNYIKENIDSSFDLSLFAYGESEVIENSGCSIITFRYKVGDFISDFGYNVIVVDNKVEEIVRVGEALYDMPVTLSTDAMDVEFDTFTENNNAAIAEDNTVINVDYIKRFDSKTKEYFVRTVTTYENEDGTRYCNGENTIF